MLLIRIGSRRSERIGIISTRRAVKHMRDDALAHRLVVKKSNGGLPWQTLTHPACRLGPPSPAVQERGFAVAHRAAPLPQCGRGCRPRITVWGRRVRVSVSV